MVDDWMDGWKPTWERTTSAETKKEERVNAHLIRNTCTKTVSNKQEEKGRKNPLDCMQCADNTGQSRNQLPGMPKHLPGLRYHVSDQRQVTEGPLLAIENTPVHKYPTQRSQDCNVKHGRMRKHLFKLFHSGLHLLKNA